MVKGLDTLLYSKLVRALGVLQAPAGGYTAKEKARVQSLSSGRRTFVRLFVVFGKLDSGDRFARCGSDRPKTDAVDINTDTESMDTIILEGYVCPSRSFRSWLGGSCKLQWKQVALSG